MEKRTQNRGGNTEQREDTELRGERTGETQQRRDRHRTEEGGQRGDTEQISK